MSVRVRVRVCDRAHAYWSVQVIYSRYITANIFESERARVRVRAPKQKKQRKEKEEKIYRGAAIDCSEAPSLAFVISCRLRCLRRFSPAADDAPPLPPTASPGTWGRSSAGPLP